jgi:hypothetical protein
MFYAYVSIVLDVYCICFMLSVSCFRGTFRGTHGFLRLCAKRSRRRGRSPHGLLPRRRSRQSARTRQARLGTDGGVKSALMQLQCNAHGGGFFPTASSCCNLARSAGNGDVNQSGRDTRHRVGVGVRSNVQTLALPFFLTWEDPDSRLVP